MTRPSGFWSALPEWSVRALAEAVLDAAGGLYGYVRPGTDKVDKGEQMGGARTCGECRFHRGAGGHTGECRGLPPTPVFNTDTHEVTFMHPKVDGRSAACSLFKRVRQR